MIFSGQYTGVTLLARAFNGPTGKPSPGTPTPEGRFVKGAGPGDLNPEIVQRLRAGWSEELPTEIVHIDMLV